jgi:hypothetical protein
VNFKPDARGPNLCKGDLENLYQIAHFIDCPQRYDATRRAGAAMPKILPGRAPFTD